MDFSLTPEQKAIEEGVAQICASFDEAYWLAKDRDAEFPHEFSKAFAAPFWVSAACQPDNSRSASR